MTSYENITYKNVTTEDLLLLVNMAIGLRNEMVREGFSEEEMKNEERWAAFINQHARLTFSGGMLRKDK